MNDNQNQDQLKTHLPTVLKPYNFVKRMKALKGLTPREYICKRGTKESKRFKLNPKPHLMRPGLWGV